MIDVSKKDLEEKLIEYRTLEQQHGVLVKRRDEIVPRVIEIKGTIDALEELGKGKGKDLLVSLGSGVFFPVKCDPKKKMVVAIGSDIISEKSIKDMKKLIEKRFEIFEVSLEKTEKELNSVESKMAVLEPKLRALMK